MPCPAAPLVGGVLERCGMPVRYRPVPEYAEASQSDDGAVLFLTSALQDDGEATGIGAVANAAGGLAAAAARSAVEEWSAMVGTHRLLGAVSPWCAGAARALDRVQETVTSADGPVHVYGWLAASAGTRRTGGVRRSLHLLAVGGAGRVHAGHPRRTGPAPRRVSYVLRPESRSRKQHR